MAMHGTRALVEVNIGKRILHITFLFDIACELLCRKEDQLGYFI